ncbi:MAG: thioredoxin family protein [Candidatus Latescibacteria bacterium]|jgi:thioredoxin-related protein|nr:thioredoxin family protein [Desulfobacteraceae bacterium]MBT4482487.1 thioredoxin family protein [Candidatus Latescibacterota bacterium]
MIKRFVKCHFVLLMFSVAIIIDSNFAEAEKSPSPESIKLTEINNTWYEDWDEGMAKANKQKKPILVDFYTNSCPGCEAMHKTTFTSPEIKKRLAADWISIKINLSNTHKKCTYDSKSMNYYKLGKYFRITGVPAFIFFDREGKPVQSVVGYKDKDLFGSILDYMKDEAYKKGISFKEYRKSGS